MTGDKIVLERAEGVAYVSLVGEYDSYWAPSLEQQLEELIGEPTPITVDLELATFLDSTVFGVLLAAQRKARAVAVPFLLILNARTGADVRRTFELTGLLGLFTVVASRAEAARQAQDARDSG
jgi:anti-anti-sigma factor